MSVAVLLAVAGPAEALIAAEVDAHQRTDLTRRCADLAEALGAADAGIGDVLIVSGSARVDRRLVARLAKHGVAVVALAAVDAERERLRTCGCTALDETSAPADVVAAALAARVAAADVATDAIDADAIADEPSGLPARDGAIVAVWGPPGAPGRSSVAANLAAELAADGDVLLVDADTAAAAQATLFALNDDVPGIAAACRAAASGELTATGLQRTSVEVAPRLRLITGLARADRWAEVSAPALDALWPLARDVADVTVVDCAAGVDGAYAETSLGGASRDAAATSALAVADVVLVVGTCEPVGMQRLVHALADLGSSGAGRAAERMVVVNRLRSSAAGDRPHEAVADVVARYAGEPQVWTVPYDLRAMDEAARLGQSLRECAPRAKARTAIADLAAQVATLLQARAAAAEQRDAVGAA